MFLYPKNIPMKNIKIVFTVFIILLSLSASAKLVEINDAKLAGKKLEGYKKVMDTIPTERKRKAFIKKAQKELEAQFGEQLKNLSFSQGKILIKLVYRETGSSTFDIVKELRGSFSAFIWQTMARLFGYDLKTPYDPAGEDQAIEKIVLMIENGS